MRTGIVTLLLTTLLALPGSGQEKPVPSTSPVAFSPPRLYASLFIPSSTWTFRVENEGTAYDNSGHPRAQTSVSSSVCRVTQTTTWPTAIASRIECDGELSPEYLRNAIPVAGPFIDAYWLANSEGIWRLESLALGAEEPPVLAHKTMLLPARPVAKTERHEIDESGDLWRVWRVRRTWCMLRTSWSGDSDAHSFCFAPSTGFRAGSFAFGGGEYREVRFCVGRTACTLLPN
jgi:hypothetical protein